MFSAKIILDSINKYNLSRLTTFELTYPRFIHAEFMTHRHFSRNAASSRAIPISKMLEMVKSNPAMPIFWGQNKKGMAADSEVVDIEKCKQEWLNARDSAIKHVEEMQKLNLHKQIVNRILEPFVWITVICTATEYNNFFELRDHPDAQPEIQYLAKLMKSEYKNSTPLEREWHIPYLQEDEKDLPIITKAQIGTARCARVSYLTHDGKRDIDKDLELFTRLLNGSGRGHWSPFEHIAKATELEENRFNFVTQQYENGPIWSGNFKGWIQYRKLHNGECA